MDVKYQRYTLYSKTAKLGIRWMAAMLRDVVHRHCCRWAHAPVIHVASHFYHEKRVAWVSISMHACDSVPIVMGLCLAAVPLELRYKYHLFKNG